MPTVRIRDASDLRDVAREIRTVADGKALRKELTGGIRGVLRPLVPVVRAAYRGMPSQGQRKSPKTRAKLPDLRVLLAKSVRVEVRTSGKLAGARIRADGRRMPDTFKSIPAYLEGEKPRWRHPLFGNREVWVAQRPAPVFYRTLEPHTDRAGKAIDQVLEDVKRKIERSR